MGAFTAVRASRGMMVWAEPVAALYQQGRVHHIGTFPQLEDQMTNFTSDIDRAAAGYSPDRVDALVWAFVPGKRGADMVGASALACRYQ